MKRLGLLLLAVVGLILSQARPADARTDSGNAGSENEIQVLNVTDEGGGTVTVEIAIPASIGELVPVRQNFGVLVDGRLQDFEVRPLTSEVDVVVVLDTSGSMQGGALDAAKSAAASFINRLPDNASVGVVSFGETVTVHSEPGNDRAAALADVRGLVSGGETALWDGLVTAAELVDRPGSGKPYIVVLADGDDTVSSTDRADATAAMKEAGIGLYAIAIASPDADGAALAETVADVGGNFAATTGVDNLDALYIEVANRLSSRYELSFRPVSGRGNMVVSVASGEAVATARTNIGSLGSATTAQAPQAPARVLNIDEESRLGVVPAPEPGLLGGANMFLIGLGTMFLALLLLALLMVSPSIQVKLDSAAGADRVAGINGRVTRVADGLIARRDREGELDKALDAAGLHLRPGEFIVGSMVFVVAITLLTTAFVGFFAGIAAAVAASVAVFVYLSTRADRRRAKFADQLTDSLAIMTGSLRAGRGLPQAIELVSAEAPSPTAEQFRRIVFETRVGRDLTESMFAVADRMRSQDFEWVTRAVDINRELGGDLTEVLDNVADTIRDRRRVARMVRSLSAEGRASGWVLLALPVLMFLFMAWRTPENVSLLLTESLGRMMFAIGLAGMTVGYFWIRKLVDLKY